VSNEESEYIVNEVLKQKYKAELRDEFAAAGEGISFYLNSIPMAAKENLLKGVNEDYVKYYEEVTEYFQDKHPNEFKDRFITFLDMCEGPHVESIKEIDPSAFKVAKLAGAYWRGNSNNVMMTRLYAYAFETKEELKKYLELLEEAKKRDHRILGEKMQIFTFDDEVGPGLPLWLPNGAIIVEEIEKLAKETEEAYGYLRVRSPHIAKDKLYIRSGHLPYYADSMFPPMEMDGETYYLKAMNCPHHHKIFGAHPKSYRDMPQRYAEYGHCYRYEDSGSLFGLMRVRSLCMNDAHIYCTEEQFEEEFAKVVEMYLYYFDIFGIKEYKMRLSKHSKEGLGKKYVDNEALRIATEDKVRQVLIKLNVPYFEAEDEAAFYGPKIDVQIWSVIGREFSLATNQLDFAVPERFNLTYTDKDGKEKTPLCIHRAPLSTHERFVGFLLEHFAGAFPLWLAPEQVRIVPVADVFIDYAKKVEKKLKNQHFRTSIDEGNESFSKKIRNAELWKVPYILIIGEKEEKAESVSVREFKTKEQYELGVKEFVEKVKVIRDERKLA
jgi:threonyl-tRNA synthetase